MITPEMNQPQTCFACKFLRAKEMFYQNAIGDEDRYKNSIFWCLKTQEIFGPDGKLATRAECTSERPCFLE
ncbi:MAG: hypothetical protein RBU21_23745 [FCB group bacterium]|jgi:hypothetical protein|nr:hypothetical protein [FCB group bacterium]